jgi:hypothetical protein
MIKIDDNFRPRNILIYPPGNNQTFEEYFYDKYSSSNNISNRIYIPIFWTNYYISKDYGKGDISELQNLLNKLDRSKKYFTIVQYDDNILNDLFDLDILIFCQGGWGNYKEKSYAISLVCQGEVVSKEKNIFASFIGRKTHKIRDFIFQNLKKDDFFISDSVDYKTFKDVMSRSVFSLCPRGYGLTSFRICEALQSGSIPVYIYDDSLIPFENEFEFNNIGILIHESELDKIDDILKSKSNFEINNYIINGKSIYNNFFSYDGCYNKIININNGI